jgi:hypothetical protein
VDALEERVFWFFIISPGGFFFVFSFDLYFPKGGVFPNQRFFYDCNKIMNSFDIISVEHPSVTSRWNSASK